MFSRFARLAIFSLVVLLSACGVPGLAQPTATPVPTATPPPTPTAAPTNTPVPPTATATATPAPTNTPVPPTATTAPTPTMAPTMAPTRPAGGQAAPPTTGAPRPNGTVPPGWKVFPGHAKVPFVIAYPPDWEVDTSSANDGQILFTSPDGKVALLIQTTGTRNSTANIDVQRDAYYKQVSKQCTNGSGIEVTAYETISGIRFAELAATCDKPGSPLQLWTVGTGLKNGVEWDFIALSPYATFNKNTCKCAAGDFEKYLQPMLSTLNIYANP